MSALHFFVEGGVRGVEDRFAGGLMATAQYHQLPLCHQQNHYVSEKIRR